MPGAGGGRSLEHPWGTVHVSQGKVPHQHVEGRVLERSDASQPALIDVGSEKLACLLVPQRPACDTGVMITVPPLGFPGDQMAVYGIVQSVSGTGQTLENTINSCHLQY